MIDDERQAESTALYHALTDLGPDGARRRELREAGVRASTIESLYPQTFESLVPDLIDIIGHEPLPEAEIALMQVVSFAARSLRTKMEDPLASEMYEAKEDYIRQETWPTLCTHLRSILPSERLEDASTMQLNIWQAHWLMANISKLDDGTAERTRKYFCDVIAWALPNLHTTAFARILPAHA